MHEYGCVPIKLHLQKTGEGQIWSYSHSLATPAPEDTFIYISPAKSRAPLKLLIRRYYQERGLIWLKEE